MGYSTRDGSIKTYWPDDTDTTLYILASSDPTMQELLDLIDKKWPNTDLDTITIGSEHIQTDCLGYDCYDSSDYTDFITLTR